jgi:cobalt-zinc-cadmium resistance protein CzcA
MFERLVELSLHHRFAVILGAALVAIWGVYAFQGTTIEAFPDPTDTQVNVITLYPGQPAAELERQVSIPLERALNGTPGLSRLRSINLFGLSYVTLTFRDGVDPNFARAQTSERLRGVELPDGVTPTLGSFSTPIGEIYRYTLTSSTSDPMALRTLQDWTLAPQLMRVEGVADVVSYGGLVREIQVRPDPVVMASKGLTMNDLEAALHAASENASGGIVERGPEQLVIRSEGIFRDLEDIRSISVGTRGGTPIFLKDVASVRDGWIPRQGIVGRGADPDVVEGIVLMRKGENPSAVLERLRAKVDALNTGGLPAGVHIDPFYDRTELVDATLETVGHNLLEGAVLVTLVLFAFLLDLRAALIVAAVIPLALFVAFIYLFQRGMSANLISMGSVDFGIIVDGAAVIVEAIAQRMALVHPSGAAHDGRDGHGAHAPHAEAGLPVAYHVKRAVLTVVRPTVSAILIIIAAYVPIFLLQRVEGRIFAPLAHTVVAALVGSLIASITLVPVLATFAYRTPRAHRESPLLAWAARLYTPTLRAALERPRLVLGAATLSLALGVGVLATRGSEFLPELNEGALYLTFALPSNVSTTEGRRLAPTLAGVIEKIPEVDGLMWHLGRPEDGTDPKLANNLEVFVKLKPASAWSVPDLSSLVAKMNAALASIPGLEVNFSQPIRDNVNDSIAGQQGQIALKLYGEDLDRLQTLAETAKQLIESTPGAADVGLVKSGVVPEIDVRPRRSELGRFGLSMDDVQHFLAMTLGGRAVGTYWDGPRAFDVTLRLPDAARESVEHVEAMRIPVASGELVPLGAVATVHVGDGRAAINRENGERYVGIRMNVRGRDLGSFVAEAQARVSAGVPLSRGVRAEWGGEFESKERATRRLLVVVPIALVLTLGLLFQVFGSVSLAFLVLLDVPFALVGGALALWAFDLPLSIAAAVGFIALVGQAALNGVLVVSAIEDHLQRGAALLDAVVAGATERLRAVLMTAALAALGLVPAALSRSMGAETQRPIAVVIVGGTISAALLTLIVLPVSYVLLRRGLARLGLAGPEVELDDEVRGAPAPAAVSTATH